MRNFINGHYLSLTIVHEFFKKKPFLNQTTKHWIHISGFFILLISMRTSLIAAESTQVINTNLLIVGGTESGWAAAIQAARMGVPSIVIVNDIEWIGGQFTAESLVAIDENRNPQGYGHGVPFPRAGLFKELMDQIENDNTERYGTPRPGNTHVITTARPSHIEKIFRKFLKPYIQSGQIRLINHYRPVSTTLDKSNIRLREIHFQKTQTQTNNIHSQKLTIKAELTIDATDWGDVIKKTPARYEFGPDLRKTYKEPLAPLSRKGFPLTDMNPITYCMVLKETKKEQIIPKPRHYDRRNYDGMYSDNPAVIYKSRRIVDHYHFKQILQPDVLLVCYATHDYPLDILPEYLNQALEQTEKGASRKNIVQMSPEQRELIFEDAKDYTLGYLYYLQTVIFDKTADKKYNFRRFILSDEFGTKDHLPFKPYIRESLRLKAMYMMKQQDTTGYGNNSSMFAKSMYFDGIACWQFEYDFHPTGRKFLTDNKSGPWHNYFRKGRTWGPPYSGRSLFPCRSLIPEKIDGLIAAQKNLGYSSIVSSALRLHDQCIAVGQAAGSVAAISLTNKVQPRKIPGNSQFLAEVWESLCTRNKNAIPHTLWPFRDLAPSHPAFEAINLLAIRQILDIKPYEIDFKPDLPAKINWIKKVIELSRTKKQIPQSLTILKKGLTRGEFAIKWWNKIKYFPDMKFINQSNEDSDSDGINNSQDPLPYHPGQETWTENLIPSDRNGIPNADLLSINLVRAINFSGEPSKDNKVFETDSGLPYSESRKLGWNRDIQNSTRKRMRSGNRLRSTFIFTRSHDIWNCHLPNGRYKITLCIGDEDYSQPDQNVKVEGKELFLHAGTLEGDFQEKSILIDITDNQLTIEIGKAGSQSNTCLNWLIVQKAK